MDRVPTAAILPRGTNAGTERSSLKRRQLDLSFLFGELSSILVKTKMDYSNGYDKSYGRDEGESQDKQ